MKHFLLILTLCLFYNIRMDAQKISYSTDTDNPKGVKNFQIHLSPFYFDMSAANLIQMGWEVWATADIKKRFRVMASFRNAYLDMMTMKKVPVNTPNYPAKGLKNAFKVEAIGQFNFASYTRRSSIKVVLESYTTYSGNYKYTHTKFIMVPGTKWRTIGVRGGLYNLGTGIDLGDHKSSDKTGGDAFYAVNSNKVTDTLKTAGSLNTMLNSTVLAAGIDFKTVINLVINTDSYGRCATRTLNNIYIDALVGIYNKYAPVLVKPNSVASATEYKVYAKDNIPIGWRFGWQFANPERTWMSFKMEFGKRPEFKQQTWGGAFFDYNMSFNIPFKVKTLQ